MVGHPELPAWTEKGESCTMPDYELLKRPSRESGDSVQEQGELQSVYPTRSCDLANSPTPCVSKAMCHIQELKNKLQIWRQQGTHNQHHHSEDRNRNGGTWRFDSADEKMPLTPTELCIEGMGIFLQSHCESEKLGPLKRGTDGVLLEVVSLIERLESDRQETKEALQGEQKKAQRLRRKQDALSLWKQQHFPLAVQLEYEACTRDITELQWHLKVRKDQTQQVRDSLSHTEARHRRLVEDIDFVKKHGPLVKEKLWLESEIMKQIKSAQDEASETFAKLSHELSSSQQELESEELQAGNERETMTTELRDIRTQLKDRLMQLQEMNSYWDLCCAQVRESEKKVALKDNQLEAMLLQTPLLEAQETKINEVVMGLRAKLETQNKTLMQKHDEVTNLQTEIQATRCEGETNASEFEEIFTGKHQELLHLQDGNEKHKMDIEDYKKKTCESKQALKQLQKDCKRLLMKMSKNEEQRDQAEGEFTLLKAQHASTRARLDDLQEQTFIQEQSRRNETEKLKIELMSERKVIEVLQDKIESVAKDYDQTQTNCEREKAELMKEHEDISTTTAQQETEMVKLREIYTAKSEKIENLKKMLSDVLTEQKIRSNDLEQKKNVQLGHLNSVKEAHSEILLRCEQTSSRIAELKLKSDEYRKESDMMERVIDTMPHVIEELQSVSDMVVYKHSLAESLLNGLQGDVEACRNRATLSKERHSTLLTQRQAVRQDLEVNLKNALKENVVLAQEYREVQKALLVARREAACMLEEKNKAQACFQDYKQISLLQRRMHKAMLKYFKHRSVYSRAELARFQALSNQNNQKMKALQEESSRATRRVSAFLYSLTDDSTNGRDAWADAADKQGCGDNGGSKGATPALQMTE